MARRGAASQAREGTASAAWRSARPRADDGRAGAGAGGRAGRGAPGRGPSDATPTEAWEPEEWIDEGEVRDEAQRAVGRGGERRRGERDRRSSGDGRPGPPASAARAERGPVPARRDLTVGEELSAAVGGGPRAERFERRLKSASEAFRRGRFEEARKTMRPLAETAPDAPSVRELYGLTLYRLGRWKQAAKELEALHRLTGDFDQHPVLADCYRALERYPEVERLWEELKAASPDAAVVAEGRIVAAGALADQGRVDEAIERLEPGVRPSRRAQGHHLRVGYALADLYERAGDLPRARELFQRVASGDPDFVDVRSRLRSLG